VTDRDALRMRLRIANPVPDPDAIDAPELDRILLGIESQWDEARGLAPPSKAPDRIRRSRLAPVLAFAGAALLILLAVGLPMLLMGGDTELPPVEESTTVPTTTATTIPVTTVPVTVPVEPSTTTSEAPQAVPPPAMTWERVPHQPIFEDATIFEVVEGGPGLVAVGALGDWNIFGTPSLAEGGAQGVVFVSSDGYEWERIDSPAYVADTYTVIWGVATGPDGLIVAPGSYGNEDVFFLSTDGFAWDRVARQDVDSVASAGTGFIGFGEVPRDGGVGSDAALWRSTDGREWMRIEDDAFLATEEDDWTVRIVSVTEGGPGIVAIGHAGLSGGIGTGLPGVDRMAVWLSVDGTDWERLPDLNDTWAANISKDPETERLIVSGREIWISTDGYDWTKSETEYPPNQPTDASLAWAGARVVAAGPSGNLSLWVSGDRGDTWSRIDPNDPAFDGYRPGITSLIRFGNAFVAVGEAGDYGAEVGAVWIGTWDE